MRLILPALQGDDHGNGLMLVVALARLDLELAKRRRSVLHAELQQRLLEEPRQASAVRTLLAADLRSVATIGEALRIWLRAQRQLETANASGDRVNRS